MGRMVNIIGPKQLGFEDYPERALKPDEVRLETIYSGISAGTQLTLYRGRNPYIQKEFDRELRIFTDAAVEKNPYPIPGAWAYEEVGRVVELGSDVTEPKLGDIVYGTWGHRSNHVESASYAKDHVLPEGLDPVIGIYSQMGAIALNAVLDAGIRIGEIVAVFGLGVPGQIACQLARLNGARVIGVDLDEHRLELARELGAEWTFNPKDCDAALEIKRLTNGGADKCIEISGSAQALAQAVRACCYQGHVVCSGFMTEGADALVLGEEFHHNRIQIVCSQIENVGLPLSNTWNRLRMERTVMWLCQEGKLELKRLISHIMAFDDVEKAYRMLDTSTKCMQVVLKF